MPVRCPIDFSRILSDLKVPGAVDERTLRLKGLAGEGKAVEQPVQFTADRQPRAKQRRLLPGTTKKVSYLAEYEAGETPPVGKVAGTLTWIVRGAASGTARYRLRFGVARRGRLIQVPYPPHNSRGFDAAGRATAVGCFPQMQIRPLWPIRGVLHIRDGSQLVTSYHIGPAPRQRDAAATDLRRPFLYPLNGPDGVSLTEVGKPHDPRGTHAHHHSLWIAHARVDGHDFWSQRGGTIAHEGFEHMEDGPVFCRLVHKTKWMRGEKPVLRGRRTFTFYRSAGGFRLIDVELEFTPAGAGPVTLGKTTFGFLSVRVAQSMTVFDGSGEILNARGDRNEQRAHLKRAAWIDLSGPIAPGRWNGIAVFDHPGNPNHPTGWHCRNDGWACASFNMAEACTIQPGGGLRLRYRLHLHRGDAAGGRVARRYADYRCQPTVRLGHPRKR